MRLLIVISILAALGLVACGPVESTIVISRAEVAIEAAKVADADRYTPFEYYSAVTYLHKSREKRNYSHFETSIDYALKARRFAEDARKLSLDNPDRSGGEDLDRPVPVYYKGDRLD